MCCRLRVFPLDVELAATVLTIGMFEPASIVQEGETPKFWKRDVPEENCTVNVSLTAGSFEASIAPSISAYNHHKGKRITAGIYFEVSSKYAAKVGGKIEQLANVTGCKEGTAPSTLLLADYPEMPLRWETVCRGFQEELMAGAGGDET